MKRYSNTPVKVFPSTSVSRSDVRSPSRPSKKPPSHRHSSSTPVPQRSANKDKKPLIRKSLAMKLDFQKIDLRKGIFSKKQCLQEAFIDRSTGSSYGDSQSIKSTKCPSPVKDLKIDPVKDFQGFYVPEQPALMHEENFKYND